jgi:hypothetical protein
LKSSLNLSPHELDEILSPACIRSQARKIFDLTREGHTSFDYHHDKLQWTIDYVLQVIRKKYPDLNIPFHSRWGHFRAGGYDRVQKVDAKLVGLEPREKARTKLDLVITSVLLDAGAGAAWNYFDREGNQTLARSEGLGVASLSMFIAGAMSSDKKSFRADKMGLRDISSNDLEQHFQVTPENPLVGVEGRVKLLNNLAKALENKQIFKDGRPGNILDYMMNRYGSTFAAPELLRAVLDGLGPIWPGRLDSNGVNLGDVWRYSKLLQTPVMAALVPFHKLSQWMTYSLIEPIVEAGVEVTDVEGMTGLAEYRNGGLILDSGLITLKNEADQEKTWTPDADLIIEWRALTIHLLDVIGSGVQKALGKKPSEFPLAKVLEGGTWWAGRFLAQEKRAGGTPPLNIDSDGTVF